MRYLDLASKMLSAAIVTLVVGGFVIFNMEGAEAAISAIGGIFVGPAPDATARMALLIDFLFPVFYGSGLILLAIGLKSVVAETVQETSLLTALVCAMLVLAIMADFTENGFAMTALAGKGGMSTEQSFATLVKYGLIAICGPLISGLITGRDTFSGVISLILRYVVPVSLVIPATNAFPALTKLTPLSFILFLGILAVYAKREHNRQRA